MGQGIRLGGVVPVDDMAPKILLILGGVECFALVVDDQVLGLNSITYKHRVTMCGVGCDELVDGKGGDSPVDRSPWQACQPVIFVMRGVQPILTISLKEEPVALTLPGSATEQTVLAIKTPRMRRVNQCAYDGQPEGSDMWVGASCEHSDKCIPQLGGQRQLLIPTQHNRRARTTNQLSIRLALHIRTQ